jgi:hypothetical protein
MLDVPEKSRMAGVTTAVCRSYSALAFDGCPACVGAALDAVAQAGLYVLGKAAPSIVGSAAAPGSIEIAYRLVVSICDESGEPIGHDEMEATQTISAVPEDDGWDERTAEVAEEPEASDGDGDAGGSMRLDDFQTILDLVQLAPAGRGGIAGAMRGQLFGFERPIGEFDIEVHPGR